MTDIGKTAGASTVDGDIPEWTARWWVRRPDELADAATVLSVAAQALGDWGVRASRSMGYLDDGAGADAWTGTAAAAAQDALRTVLADFAAMAEELSDTVSVLRSAAGRSMDVLAVVASAAIGVAPMLLAGVVDALAALDNWLAGNLMVGVPDTESASTADSVPDRPADRATWWAALSPDEQMSVIRDRPETIGNTPGVPVASRDAANRRRLETERARLEAAAADLRLRLSDNLFGGAFSNADAGLEQTENRLSAIDALDRTLARGDRRLLEFDNSGDKETTAVVAIGDVESADHVTVFVPGVGSTVQDTLERYDTDVARTVARAEELGAEELRAEESSRDSVAGVVWMGYEAPNLGWDVLDPDHSLALPIAAHRGGAALADSLNALPGDAHVSVVGHSYGSVVAAEALALGGRADDAIMMGSPGLGDGALPAATRTYVVESPTDPIADLGWFGPDPNTLHGVTVLEATDSWGHGRYLDEGTTSASSIAAVVAGVGEPVRATLPFDAGDVARILVGAAAATLIR